MHLSYDEIRVLVKVCDDYARSLLDPYERAHHSEPPLETADLSSDEIKTLNRIRLRLGTHRARRVDSARQEEINNPYT